MAGRLKTYAEKRDFRRTPEPAPGSEAERPAGAQPRFMVHKHDARRLHYDLRLEIDGALASWAIPRGPSYDPTEKRLAVETEDHPLAYGEFEGRIPDGEYGAGDSLIWDRGTYRTEPPGDEKHQREKGHLKLVLEGEKLHGLWHLVRTRRLGDKQQWLLFKARDEHANPDYDVVAERPESVVSGRRVTRGPVSARQLRAPHPEPIQLLLGIWPPMRATLSQLAEVGARPFVFEVKYDGFRALAGLSRGRIALQSRNGLDLSTRFPSLAQELSELTVGEAVLDGEIVAFDREGISRFQLLGEPGADLAFVAFDLLWLEGEDLRGRPLEERRDLLESLLSNPPPGLQLAERVPGTAAQALETAAQRGLEGLLAKRAGSTYRGGLSRDWLKLKLRKSQDVAIVGFLPISTGGAEVGSLLAAVREDKVFRFAGRIGTGFSSAQRRDLWRVLDADRVEAPWALNSPRFRIARWVRPRYVALVEFAEWTADGLMRQPSFQGLRPDKTPEECWVEKPREPVKARPTRKRRGPSKPK